MEKIAAIDIGSSAIRMTISEIHEESTVVIEELKSPVALGNDFFKYGKIKRKTINECVTLLKRYKTLCDEYGVSRIKAVATTAVREATNSDIFIDTIINYIGIEVKVLSPLKETEYIYNALKKTIKFNKDKDSNEHFIIIEIGAGNVELTVFDNISIVLSTSLPLGSIKIKQIISSGSNYEENISKYLKALAEHEMLILNKRISFFNITKIYGISTELEYLNKILGNTGYGIKKEQLEKILSEIQDDVADELIRKYNIPSDIAQTFYATTFLFSKMIEFFKCSNIYIPKVTLRDGIIEKLTSVRDEEKYYYELKYQLKVNAVNIGRSLNFDEKHALQVSIIAKKLFDEFKQLHQLGHREKCYLLVASILHDIGSSISNRAHHKHSLYIIKAQQFLHFSDEEVKIVANVARYHRKALPKTSHLDYMNLSQKNRIIVLKLSSILRIADALDNSHLQLVKDVVVDNIKSNKIKINAFVKNNIFIEQFSFNSKKDFFQEVFGYKLELDIVKNK